MAESALAGGLDPGSSGGRYQVVIHVNEEELRRREDGSMAGGVPARASAEAADAGKVRMAADGAVQFFHPRGRPQHESPAPPPVGPYPCEDLVRDLEDSGILVTGQESMPAWDGTPMDLRYVMECLWKPPPHLQAAVDRERYGGPVRKQSEPRAA